MNPLDSENSLFLPVVGYDPGGLGTSTVIADVNHDGNPDLIVGNQGGESPFSDEGSVGVLLGNGDGTFQPVVKYDSGGDKALSVAVADLNNDGKPDIVVTNNCASNTNCQQGPVSVLLGHGDGTFDAPVSYDSGGFLGSVVIADLNGDGKPDLAVANSSGGSNGAGSLGVLLGNGDGTFQPVVLYTTNRVTLFFSLAVADVNGDGKPDVVVESGLLCVFLGNGDGTFQPAVMYSPGGIEPSSVAIADLNGDSKPDLLVANACGTDVDCHSPSTVSVLLGNGDGTFKPAVAYDARGRFSEAVVVADIDGDGKLDVMAATGGSTSVSLLLGNGDGSFQPGVSFDAGGQPVSVAVADLNGDGKQDVVATNGCIFGGCGGVPLGVLMNNSGPHGSTTTTLSASVDPAARRQTVTYSALVTSLDGKPITGDVIFQDGGVAFASLHLVGNRATYSTDYKHTGTHAITAAYSGDAENLGSQSPIVMEHIENFPIPTTTTLTTSGSPVLVGQSVTFTATVTWKDGKGRDGELVTFEDAGKPVATVPLAGGTATYTTSLLTAKNHIIRARYAGDTTFKSSIGTVFQVVNLYRSSTTLTSSSNPSRVGHPLTFTATVSSSASTGSTGKVIFKDGTETIRIKALIGGVASLTESTLSPGSHSITAEYEGDTVSGKSTSSVLTQIVNQ